MVVVVRGFLTVTFFALALVSILAFAAVPPALGQIVACSGVSQPGYKVLVDDITPKGLATSPLMLPLIHRLDANLEQLRVETGIRLVFVRCDKRRPKDPSDFRKQLVQNLNANKVVLELWGTTAEVTKPDGEIYHEASIGYALIPIRFFEFDSGEPPGVFLVSRQTKSVASTEELVSLVDQGGTLAAYASLAAGTKLLKERSYDRARTQLCKAEALLTALFPQPSSTDEALNSYARRLAAEAITAARADTAYVGVFKLPQFAGVPPKCGGQP